MNKVILICLLLVIPTAFAAADCNNPLLAALGITPKLSQPTAQTGLAFCQNLEGDLLCASSTVINDLQNTINSLVLDLVEEAAERDAWWITLRTSTTDGVPSLSSQFTTLETNAKAALATVNTAIQGGTSNTLTNLKARITPYTTITTTVASDIKTAGDNWSKYQAARATCINSLVKAQASIYCLAYTSDYATAGGVTGTDASDAAVSLAATFETSIQKDCYDYVTYAQEQNTLIDDYSYKGAFTDLNTLLNLIATSVTGRSAADFNAPEAKKTQFTDVSKAPVISEAASPCSSNTACDIIYNAFLEDGAVLNKLFVANGGIILQGGLGARVLANARMLVDYDPSADTNSAGVTVAFPNDPIAYLNSAWRQGGLMTCVVALVAMLLF